MIAILLLAAHFSPVHDCTGTEYRRLDFWLGDWEVKSPAGKNEGRNLVSPAADGCGVEESWHDADGSTGRSLFFYDRAAARWKQVWVTSTGEWKEKVEQPSAVPGAVRFAGELPRPGGGTLLDRTTLTPLPDGRVRQVIEQSPDGGKSWRAWEGVYTRQPRAPACANRDFDFWVGSWDLVVRAPPAPGQPWAEAKGTNQIDSTYAGCVIEEHFRADGPGGFWQGHSVSAFQNGKWRQTWVDDAGGFIALIGGWDGKQLELRGEPREQNGKTIVMRMVFSDISRDKLHWSWERSEDVGRAFVPIMTIDYQRHKGGPR